MRNLLYIIIVAIVLVTAETGLVWAQPLRTNTVKETTLSQDDVYTIVSGDSLAALSPTKWRELKAMNPFLDAPNRTQVRSDGWTKVFIYPGEKIRGPRALGIEVENAAAQTATPLTSPSPAATQKPQTGTTEEQGIFSWIFWTTFAWLPWLLLPLFAVAAAIAIYLLWFSRNRGNAASAGPKYVRDGINDRTAAGEFLRQAQHSFGAGTAPLESFRIENLRRRRASGTINVGYKDGTTQSRILENEVVYIADLHYPDGSIRRDQMLLSACGNPLRASGNVAAYVPGFNFRFVDEQPQVVRINESEPQVIAQPATATSVKTRDGIFFTEDSLGASVEINGKTIEFAITPDMSFKLGQDRSVNVFRNWVQLRIENGRITDFGLDGMPKKVVPIEQASEQEANSEDKNEAAAASNAS